MQGFPAGPLCCLAAPHFSVKDFLVRISSFAAFINGCCIHQARPAACTDTLEIVAAILKVCSDQCSECSESIYCCLCRSVGSCFALTMREKQLPPQGSQAEVTSRQAPCRCATLCSLCPHAVNSCKLMGLHPGNQCLYQQLQVLDQSLPVLLGMVLPAFSCNAAPSSCSSASGIAGRCLPALGDFPCCSPDPPWPPILQLPCAYWMSRWTSGIKHMLPLYVSTGQALTRLPVTASVLCAV